MGPTFAKYFLVALAALALAACPSDDSTPPATTGAPDAVGTDAGGDAAVDSAATPDTPPVEDATPDASPSDALAEVSVPDADAVADMVAEDLPVMPPDVADDTGPDAVEDVASALCPPAGPYGHGVGNTLTNYTLMTCDNEPVEVHDLCGANAGLIFNFYGW